MPSKTSLRSKAIPPWMHPTSSKTSLKMCEDRVEDYSY
jgi:hypothetical protein